CNKERKWGKYPFTAASIDSPSIHSAISIVKIITAGESEKNHRLLFFVRGVTIFSKLVFPFSMLQCE
ncbi:hypothetical protein P9223_14825, partial [Geobacillus stearothermophilus]|uniref:hypothetical protein n=3 Tax=Geobacillus stearothermophilus TaxID=1422 RepID=UPI002E2103AF|nr:hypothetical protein [Geobacillus stearothermophilus]